MGNRLEPLFENKIFDRRKAVALFGTAGAAALLPKFANEPSIVDAATCLAATPSATEGPYWVDEKLNRSDIRTDPATGVARAGVPLTLTINVTNSINGGCVPLVGALVDIWHCDAKGIYSDEPSYNPGGGTGTVVTSGQKFLRGYQTTDGNGQVQFTTIYPGWYSGRTIHIHARVRTYSGNTVLGNFVTQFFFDETISNTVLSQAAYTRTTGRDTTNAGDNVLSGVRTNAAGMMLNLTGNSAAYAGSITLDVNLQTPAVVTTPVIHAGGIGDAAGGSPGVTSGSWISIYGTNLASTTKSMSPTDIVNGKIPTALGGVSVKIDNKDAFIYFVAPTQINVLSPTDANRGAVPVTVTNTQGTSPTVSTNLSEVLPGLFTLSKYVRAVRPIDSVIINGTGAAESGYASVAAAKPGDVIELFGTGFGPVSTTVTDGLVFIAAYETTNRVTVAIGGQSAVVSFAGLVGPGLYQINVEVPKTLGNADHAVIASVAGVSSPNTALLKVSNV